MLPRPDPVRRSVAAAVAGSRSRTAPVVPSPSRRGMSSPACPARRLIPGGLLLRCPQTQGMTLADKAGLKQSDMLEVLGLGAMANPMFALKASGAARHSWVQRHMSGQALRPRRQRIRQGGTRLPACPPADSSSCCTIGATSCLLPGGAECNAALRRHAMHLRLIVRRPSFLLARLLPADCPLTAATACVRVCVCTGPSADGTGVSSRLPAEAPAEGHAAGAGAGVRAGHLVGPGGLPTALPSSPAHGSTHSKLTPNSRRLLTPLLLASTPFPSLPRTFRDSLNQPLPVAAAANESFKRAKARGFGDNDFAALYEAYQQ